MCGACYLCVIMEELPSVSGTNSVLHQDTSETRIHYFYIRIYGKQNIPGNLKRLVACYRSYRGKKLLTANFIVLGSKDNKHLSASLDRRLYEERQIPNHKLQPKGVLTTKQHPGP